MQSELVNQGVDLMLYGMGTVFVFLMVLIVVTSLMSSLVNRFAEPEQPALVPAPATKAAAGGAAVEPRVLKIIEAAIAQHRNR